MQKRQKPGNKFIKKNQKCQIINTEMEPLSKNNKARMNFPFQEYLQTESLPQKKKIKCKDLQKQLLALKNNLQAELQYLLSSERNNKKWKQSEDLLMIKSFRIKIVSPGQLLDNYSKIIQGLQLLFSKLHNNQKIKDTIHVKNEQDFLLFFKYLFGKPYTLCNLPYFRKILDIIWHREIFPSLSIQKISEHLKLWAHGIELPINPAAIQLQKLVFQGPEQTKKYTSFLKNSLVYCHINKADCAGLTPIQVAVHANKTNAYQYLLKSGADIFLCPLTLSKGKKSILQKQQKNKITFQIVFPQYYRIQFNCLEILLVHKQYQKILDVFTCQQISKIKRMRKKRKQIIEKIEQIPDCCFEIHWKTFKGFLNFKELPKDVITIRKKGKCLRIDYHINDFEKISEIGYYTILLKQCNNKLQYYFIDHKNKKIVNLMRQLDKQKLKTRYEQFVQFGCLQQLKLANFKSVSKLADKISTQISCQFVYDNVSKADIFNFKSQSDYEKMLVSSDLINYKALENDELLCTLNQEIFTQIPKVKSRNQKCSNTFSIEWSSEEKLKLKHIVEILGILDNKSIFFIKFSLILKTLNEQKFFKDNFSFTSRIPQKIVITGPLNTSDISLEISLKNIVYIKKNNGFLLEDQFFEIDYCLDNMGYEDKGQGLNSLQQTIVMDENYTINISSFLGKTERLREKEDFEANKLFEELLTREIEQASEEEDQESKNIA